MSDASTTPADILSLDIEGHFWAPDTPRRKVRGRLQWSERSGTLRLERILRDDSRLLADEIDLIVGESLFGEPLCLTDCFVNQVQIARVQYPQTWTVNQALLGSGVPSPAIDGLELRLADIRPFYGEPTFSHQRTREDARDRLDITWQSSAEITVQLGDVRLQFDEDWNTSGTATGFHLDGSPRIRLIPSSSSTEAKLMMLANSLVMLISICQGRYVDITETRLLLPDDRQARRLQGRRFARRNSYSSRGWLTLADLTPAGATIGAWLKLCDELSTAMAMIVEYLLSGSGTTLENKLLYLTRFIEQYHRARFDAQRMPKAEFRKMRKAARDQLTGALGEWVYDNTAHANERRLAERLNELVTKHKTALGGALGVHSADFATSVADSRNYYTHYSDYLAAKAVRGIELARLVDRLWALVRVCLLDEMGFDAARAARLMRVDRKLEWLANQP